MKRLILIFALLWAVTASWAAIAPVGTPLSAQGTGSTDTTAMTYSPTTGDPVIMFLNLTSSATSPVCSDGTTNLTLVSSVATVSSYTLRLFYLPSANSAHTAFGCQWTGSATYGATLQEYSGNTNGVNNALTVASSSMTCSGASCTGSSISTADISATLDEANDWVICGFSASAAFTWTVGHLRITQSTNPKESVGDNTATSVTTVHCTATLSATSVRAVAMELRVTASAPAHTPMLTIMGVGD